MNSQQKFTAVSISVADGAEYTPVLKSNAFNQMCVTRWLADITRTDDADANKRNSSRVLWARGSLNNLFSEGPFWLLDAEAAQVDLARQTFFGTWGRLNAHGGRDKVAGHPKTSRVDAPIGCHCVHPAEIELLLVLRR